MKCVEFGDEVILVFVPICHPLHRSDLVIDSFERSAGDRIVVPIENACTISFQCPGHGNQNSDSGCASTGTPHLGRMVTFRVVTPSSHLANAVSWQHANKGGVIHKEPAIDIMHPAAACKKMLCPHDGQSYGPGRHQEEMPEFRELHGYDFNRRWSQERLKINMVPIAVASENGFSIPAQHPAHPLPPEPSICEVPDGRQTPAGRAGLRS